MTDLFQRINEVVPTLQGWCELEKAHALAAAVVALRPNRIVEVGVFAGRSLIPMAMACEALGKGTVVAIDPWTTDAAVDGYDGANREWWSSVDLEKIYRDFVGTVARLGLTDRVDVQRVRSDDAKLAAAYDIAHLDGQHTDQAVRDVKRFAARVRSGGLCILDDINWTNASGTSVGTAVHELVNHGFFQLYPLGTGAVFQRG